MSNELTDAGVDRDAGGVRAALTPAQPPRSPWGYDAYPAARAASSSRAGDARAEPKPFRLGARYRGRVRYYIEGQFVHERPI